MLSIHLLALLESVTVLILVLGACIGFGRLLIALGGFSDLDFFEERFNATTALLGFCAALLVLGITHFWFPLNHRVSGVVYGIGLLFFLWEMRNRWKFKGSYSPKFLLVSALVLLLLVWACSRVMITPSAYDTGLYHLTAVSWIDSFPIVPGLANVHGRLGFNQSYFLFAASIGDGQTGMRANVFVFMLCIWQCLEFFSRTRDRARDSDAVIPQLVSLSLISLCVYTAIQPAVMASLSPDTVLYFLQISAFLLFCRSLENSTTMCAERAGIGFAIAVLVTTAVTVKVGTLGFSLLLCFYAFWIVAKQEHEIRLSKTWRLFLICSVISVFWMVRGYITSGYPVFPSTLLGLDFSWSVSERAAETEANWVYSWARVPGAEPSSVLESFDWFVPWMKNRLGDSTVFLTPLLFLVGIILFLGYQRLKGRSVASARKGFLLLSPLLAGLVFWFFTAPDIRFAQSLFLLLPVASVTIVLWQLKGLVPFHLTQVKYLLSIFLITNFHLLGDLLSPARYSEISLVGWQGVPEVQMEVATTESGLEVFVPSEGDQCWDAKLPCTPLFDPELRLRASGDFSKGFTKSSGGIDEP